MREILDNSRAQFDRISTVVTSSGSPDLVRRGSVTGHRLAGTMIAKTA
jgi:hypothetical protein